MVSDKQGYVILSCTAEVLDDEALKAAKWEGWMARSDGELTINEAEAKVDRYLARDSFGKIATGLER